MFLRFLVFIPLFSSSTLTGLDFWDMPLLVKWKKFILCSHIGSNNHVAYPSWIWYFWNDYVLISCTNETARLSYSKELSLSLLCTLHTHYANGKAIHFPPVGFSVNAAMHTSVVPIFQQLYGSISSHCLQISNHFEPKRFCLCWW